MNRYLGIQVLQHVMTIPEIQIKIIVLNNERKRSGEFLHIVKNIASKYSSEIQIMDWSAKNQKTIIKIAETCYFGVSALFGHKIPPELICAFKKGIINLHPSYLPFGKGADPVAWGIISKQDQGASIHVVSEKIDSGGILSQEKIFTNLGMNSGEIYDKCIESLYLQFCTTLVPWLEGKIVPRNQGLIDCPTRKSEELDELRILSASEITSVESLILRLQALSYNDGRCPMYKDEDGNLWDIRFNLSPQIDQDSQEKK